MLRRQNPVQPISRKVGKYSAKRTYPKAVCRDYTTKERGCDGLYRLVEVVEANAMAKSEGEQGCAPVVYKTRDEWEC